MLFMLWVQWWLAIPAPPPPWLWNAGCPYVPAARSLPLIPAVFVLSSSWTCCSLAFWICPRDGEWWWLEETSVTWGWWTCDSQWLLDKSFSSLHFNFVVCERGRTNSPTAKLGCIEPLKCLDIQTLILSTQRELLIFPILNISSLDKSGSFCSLFLFSQDIWQTQKDIV